MKKPIKIVTLLTLVLASSVFPFVFTQAREVMSEPLTYNLGNQDLDSPVHIALLWNSKIPQDYDIQYERELIQDIFRIWKIAPLDLIDLAEGIDEQNLKDAYSTLIIPSLELLDPDTTFPVTPISTETREAITNAIIDQSVNVILCNASVTDEFANPLFNSIFNITTDGSQFRIGEGFIQLFEVHKQDSEWILGHSGNNVMLIGSLLSAWWDLTSYNEIMLNESNTDFTAKNFFNIIGLALPENIAWIFGVPALTIRNDDTYVRSWRYELDEIAIKQYAEFLRQEAGYYEASNGIVGLYDQETLWGSERYQQVQGNYGRIVSHSWTHPFMSTLSLEEQIDQLDTTVFYLNETYYDQYDPSLFIVPNNDWNELTLVALNKTGHSIFTATNFPVPFEYMSSPAKIGAYLLYDWYTVEYEGSNYTIYGYPWAYAYDASDIEIAGSQGNQDFNRTPLGWITEDYAQEGYPQTIRALSEFYYPLMMGTHGVLQAWEYFPEWAEITRNIMEGVHSEYPYIRVADNGAAVRDVMNLENIKLESASYSDSEISLTLHNPGPEIKNAVLFTNSMMSRQIDQVFVNNSPHLGFGDNYVFVPMFTGSIQLRIKLSTSIDSSAELPILRGITAGGLRKTSITNNDISFEIAGFEKPNMFETTILSIDLTRISDDPSNIGVERVYVQGEGEERGIYYIDDLKQDWDGWNYNSQTGILKIKARIFGIEQVHILLEEHPTINHSPIASIKTPEDQSVYTNIATITLEAEASDEDGDKLSYSWISSLDGDIGFVQKLTLKGDDLSPGNHTITLLVAEDGPHYSHAGRDNIYILITPRHPIRSGVQTLLKIAAIISGVSIVIPLVAKRRRKSEKEKESEKSSLSEILYYSFLSNGPWLVATAMFLVLGMGFMLLLDYPEKRFFAFSLGISMPVSLILAGWLVGLSATSISDSYTANKIFSCRHFLKRFIIIATLATVIVGGSIFGIIRYQGFLMGTAFLTFFFVVSFTPLWYSIGILNAFKQYGRMTIFFVGGIGVGYSLSILFTGTGRSIPQIGLAYGIGYLIAAIAIIIFIFTALLPPPQIQQMTKEEDKLLLALLSNPTRADTVEAVKEKTNISVPLTKENIALLEDGLQLRIEGKGALSLRRAIRENSWIIIGAICYASFVWIDRIIVWIATGQETSGFVLAINSTYEIGVNIGLWVLIFTTGMIAYTFKSFSNKYTETTAQLYTGTLDEIESEITGLSGDLFKQLLRIIGMATVIAVIIFVNARPILKLFNMGSVFTELGIESMKPVVASEIANPGGVVASPSIFVLRIATIDAIFVATFLYVQLGLSYLGLHKKAALVLLIAVVVAFTLAVVIVLLGAPSYYAVIGHLGGSIAASAFGFTQLRGELKSSEIIHRYLSHQL